MTSYEQINDQRFRQVRDAAWEVAKGGDPEDLKVAFGDYFDWHEQCVQDYKLLTFGGMPYSQHNRAVCAGQLARAVRFDYEASDQQLRRLSKELADILDLRKTVAARFDELSATKSQQNIVLKL